LDIGIVGIIVDQV